MLAADLLSISQHQRADPSKLIRDVRGDVDWIVMKALEKDRARRYATAHGLALDVQRYLAGESISARPPSKLYKLQKAVLRNKLLFAGIAVVALFLFVSLVVVSASLAKEQQARHDADAALKQAKADKAKAEKESAKSPASNAIPRRDAARRWAFGGAGRGYQIATTYSGSNRWAGRQRDG